MATNVCHKQLVRILDQTKNQLDNLNAEISRQLAEAMKGYRLKDPRNPWKGNAAIEKRVDKILQGMDSRWKATYLQNQKTAIDLSGNCNDAIVQRMVHGKDIPEELKASYFARPTEAMNAWLLSRQDKMRLSAAVWDLGATSKDQIEFLLKEGLADGRDARSLARDLKSYLKEPNRRFRRVRDPKTGKLKLSQPAKLYKPGPGVYRSSYMNALRLARNEINIAYRQADFERRKNIDFIVGIRVNLSNAHPKYDICDELQGVYPKNFSFWGWHPNCICFTTTILMGEEDFVKGAREGNFDHARKIDKIPARATDYLNKNSDQIKGWKNRPYFIEQNFKNVKGGFELKAGVTK